MLLKSPRIVRFYEKQHYAKSHCSRTIYLVNDQNRQNEIVKCTFCHFSKEFFWYFTLLLTNLHLGVHMLKKHCLFFNDQNSKCKKAQIIYPTKHKLYQISYFQLFLKLKNRTIARNDRTIGGIKMKPISHYCEDRTVLILTMR